jgi:protein FAM50
MGDFGARFHRPDAGIHTVEGNVAGSRAASLVRKRQAEQDAYEERKRKIIHENQKSSSGIMDKFSVEGVSAKKEQEFRQKTFGLVTAEEFAKAQKESTTKDNDDDPNNINNNNAKSEEDKAKEQALLEKQKKKERKKARKKKKKMLSTLSFADADDAEGMFESTHDDDNDNKLDEVEQEVKKNPLVDTSFLPDRKREEALATKRLELQQEWKEAQGRIRKELLEITYSYWDGSGHRRFVQVEKGETVGAFLEKVRKDLCKEFREMQNITSGDALLYVKEDLIIPQDITFYDLIVTKARGKSGPLFNFDVHDDVRVGAIDSRVEKDESHPGKVVERRWYDRNKHIFPASRWEVFDPNKDYGRYTIHGGEVQSNSKKK